MTTFTLTCIAAELSRALQLVSQVAGRDKMLPILRAVRITAKSGSASISATNMDHGATATIAAEGDGVIYVDASMISVKAGAIRPDKPVTISSEDGKTAAMVQGRNRYTLPLLDGEAFPSVMTGSVNGPSVTMTAGPLLAALSVSPDAITPSSDRAIGMGALLDMSDGKFRVVAGNGQIFSVIEVDAPPLAVSDAIVPLGAIGSICGMFKEADSIDVVLTDDAMSIKADGLVYRTKLVEMKYPDWQAAVKRQAGDNLDGSAVLVASDVADTTKRASAIAEDSNKQNGTFIPIRIIIKDGELGMVTQNSRGEVGEDACACDGPDGSFGVNAINLRKMVSNIGSMDVCIRYSTTANDQPIVIHASPSERENFRIVMPIRMGF